MVYFESNTVKVSYNNAGALAVTEWSGFSTFEKSQEGNMKSLELIQQKRTRKWLVDSRKGTVMTQDTLKWINEVFNPMVVQAGVKKIAVVLSDNVFSQLGVKNISTHLEEYDLEIHNFNTLAEAEEWLRKQ